MFTPSQRRLPAEWERQSMVQITWPSAATDWASTLDEVTKCYQKIAQEISDREMLIVVTDNKSEAEKQLSHCDSKHITILEMPINDTWARDHGFITVREDDKLVALDFQFNGWGLKYAANHDNAINRKLFADHLSKSEVEYENHLSTVLEGGSIESDGQGTIMTTTKCLMSPNRNGADTQEQIEERLKSDFGAYKVLWLDHGHLEGDDTDSHIDTLARFAPNDTILYVRCTDCNDEHYADLTEMESDLRKFRNAEGRPYNLVALPMVTPQYDSEGTRLPATYANFLYVNGAVLVPTYNAPSDNDALTIFRAIFPDRDVVPVDCSILIQQHGSLHCSAMQFPNF